MPMVQPSAPPRNAVQNKEASEMRQAPRMALFFIHTHYDKTSQIDNDVTGKEKYHGLLLKHINVLLSHFHCANLAGKTEQVDEAFCVVMVVQITGLEGSDALIIQSSKERLCQP